jgi:hypothetical protein
MRSGRASAATTVAPPVGGMRTLVSLVDRAPFDDGVYPADTPVSALAPRAPDATGLGSLAGAADGTPAAVVTSEVAEVSPSGAVAWGERMTFTLGWPWPGDALTWLALRLQPFSWLPDAVTQGLRQGSLAPADGSGAFVWADRLALAALARVELEIGGVTVEAWGGEWADAASKLLLDTGRGAAWDGLAGCPVAAGTVASEDGTVAAYLPFWFGRRGGAPLPVFAMGPQTPLRLHVTLRRFGDVVRRAAARLAPGDSPLFPTLHTFAAVPGGSLSVVAGPAAPPLVIATLLVGVAHLPMAARRALMPQPHEYPMEAVAHAVFGEPLKYAVLAADSRVTVSLPLDVANGPVRSIAFLLRRTGGVAAFRAYTEYGAVLEDEGTDQPLLRAARLYVGGTLWRSAEERECRATAALRLPGGARAYAAYVYALHFAEAPGEPGLVTGSLNASCVDSVRLQLDVAAPGADGDVGGGWEVHVFALSHNWLRTQNGLAGVVFCD